MTKGSDSDLKVIDEVCRYYNIPSIIGFDKRGIPYVRGYDYQLCNIDPNKLALNRFGWYYHIDLYEVYKKPLVKSVLYQGKYRNLKLGTVSKVILNEGKFENLNGLQIQQLPKEKQLEYVSHDAKLVMKLSIHNNYAVLDLMNAISIITNVKFDRVCNTNISTWWKQVITDKISSSECKLAIW